MFGIGKKPNNTSSALDNTIDLSHVEVPVIDFGEKDWAKVLAPNSVAIGYNKYGQSTGVCMNADGTISYHPIPRSISDLYEELFDSLCYTHDSKAGDWRVLLKLNDNDYRLTVIQIETELLKTENLSEKQ